MKIMDEAAVALGLFLLCVSGSTQVAHAQGTPEDDAEIRSLIERHAAADAARDLPTSMLLYHEDAEIYWSNGSVSAGRAAIERAHTDGFTSAAARSGRRHVHPPETIRIRFIRPDVAIAEVESHSMGGTDAEGRPLPSSRVLLTTTWTREDGRWAVAYQRSVGSVPD